MQVKKQQSELGMEQQTGSKLGKEYIKAIYCHPAYLTYIHHHAKCWAGWSTAGIKIARRNINNLRHADDTMLMAESEEELKSHLMKVKEESEKPGLKLNIQKMKIPSLHGKEMRKQWQALFSWAPKSVQMVTATMKLKDACSLEEKPWET